jgi:hypothetical protein
VGRAGDAVIAATAVLSLIEAQNPHSKGLVTAVFTMLKHALRQQPFTYQSLKIPCKTPDHWGVLDLYTGFDIPILGCFGEICRCDKRYFMIGNNAFCVKA